MVFVLNKLLPWCKTLVTLLCKPSRGPELALGPLGAPEYESRLNSRSRVPLSTFSCRFYQLRWWSPAEVHWTVHVDCPRGQIQTFLVIRAKRPLRASLLSLTVLGVPQGTKGELGAAFWHLVPQMSGLSTWTVHVDSPRGPRLATTTYDG